MFFKKRIRTTVLKGMACAACCLSMQQAFSQLSPAELVKSYVTTNQQRLRVTPTEAGNLVVTKDYVDKTTGIRHTYATQQLNGLVITNSAFSLHTKNTKQFEANNLVPVLNYAVSPVQATVRSDEAISKVFDAINYTAPRSLTIKSAPQGTDSYTVYKRNENKLWDVPCRLVYYNDQRLKALVPAWEVQMMDMGGMHYWLAYVDSKTGKLLERKDLMKHCSFDGIATDEHETTAAVTKKTSAQFAAAYKSPAAASSASALPSNQYRVYDMPFESPIDPGSVHALSSKSGDVLASPDGWHKVDNAVSYNFSRGNNVFAFWDQSPGPLGGVPLVDSFHVAYPTNRIAGVPPVVEPFVFDFSILPGTEPETYTKAAIVNLFYWNNLMHDVFYHLGFDEASGNFEESHVFSTRSSEDGLSGDAVLAQAQDGGGTNNANFLTLPDGTNGQMQMYLWTTAKPDSLVQITSSTSDVPPAGKKYLSIQGSLNALPTGSVNLYTNPVENKMLVMVKKNALSTVGTETQGCTSGQQSIALPPSNDVSGKIAVIDRGNCTFVEKVLGAQMGGAVGVIIINNVDGDPQPFGGSDAPGNAINIPAVMVSKADGEVIKGQLLAGATVIGSLKRNSPPEPKRDGDIDNGVIAHEYGHGISNRLTGGPNSLLPLGGDEQGGEGWSDFLALYMTMRTNDLSHKTPRHPYGSLPSRSIGNYVTYQNYDGQGIREYPYSIDLKINPATFAYIKRPDYSETHSVGFVWCSMLYELFQSFIDEYGMNDNVYEGANPTAEHNPPAAAKGNNIATRLVIEGMKLQPTNPTFIEERDAILRADTLLYNGQHGCLIWKAFAKRGLGYSAVSGSDALGDETEAFDLPFSCNPNQTRIRIVKNGPVKIVDNTNVTYTITVTNLLPTALKDVLIVDTIPYPSKVISTSDGAVYKNRIIRWHVPVAGNSSKTVTAVIRVNPKTASKEIFGENNEGTTSSYTAQNNGGLDNWSLVNNAAQAFSGNKFWFIPDTDFGGSNATLRTTNKINIPADGELVFIHKFATEAGYDGGVVEVSTDGTNWSYLPPNKFVSGGYNSVISTLDNPGIGASDLAAFSGASAGYQVSIAKLNDYANQSIYVRFRFTTDALGGSVDDGGWWIDDAYVLSGRTQYTNIANGITNAKVEISENEGTNASSSTSAFVIEGAAAKPGELTNLTPNAQKEVVTLEWKAINEDNVIGYQVERKEAGTTDFVIVGEVEPSMLYAEVNDYNFKDVNVSSGKKYEYRVKQVKESASRYTNIALVDMDAKPFAVSVFPNPADNVANLSIDNPKGEAMTIHLFDASGKKLTTFKTERTTQKVMALPVKGLKPGTYWIEVANGSEHKTVQMIKK